MKRSRAPKTSPRNLDPRCVSRAIVRSMNPVHQVKFLSRAQRERMEKGVK